MHSFEVHSNESACRKNVRFGLEQVLCVLCSCLFHSDVDIAKMEDSIKKGIKVKKARKLPNVVLLCGIKFYVMPTQPFWSLWGVYSNKLPIALNIKMNLPLINI